MLIGYTVRAMGFEVEEVTDENSRSLTENADVNVRLAEKGGMHELIYVYPTRRKAIENAILRHELAIKSLKALMLQEDRIRATMSGDEIFRMACDITRKYAEGVRDAERIIE